MRDVIPVLRIPLSIDPPTVTGSFGVPSVRNMFTQTFLSCAAVDAGHTLLTVLTIVTDEYVPPTFEFAWVGCIDKFGSCFETA